MKQSKRNIHNQVSKAERRLPKPPKLSKYAAKQRSCYANALRGKPMENA